MIFLFLTVFHVHRPIHNLIRITNDTGRVDHRSIQRTKVSEFLLVFNQGSFSEDGTFLLSEWLAHTPPEVLAKKGELPD